MGTPFLPIIAVEEECQDPRYVSLDASILSIEGFAIFGNAFSGKLRRRIYLVDCGNADGHLGLVTVLLSTI